jgi:hypothetical protein
MYVYSIYVELKSKKEIYMELTCLYVQWYGLVLAKTK